MLELVSERPPLPPGRRYVTYVASRNQLAKRFFEKSGWNQTEAPRHEGILEYERVA